MMTRRAAAVLGAAALLLLGAACSTAGQPQAISTPTTVTVTATATQTEISRVTRTSEVPVTVTVTEAGPSTTYVTPAGYDSWGGGLATKWSDDGTFECSADSESCWGVELYTDTGCAAGVYVSLDLYRGEDKIDVLDATTSPRPAGEYLSLVLGQSGNGTGLEASITDVRCTG